MTVRDRIACAVIAGAVLLALPLWWAGATWVGAGLVLLSILAAAVVYRVEVREDADEGAVRPVEERPRR